MSLLDSLPAPSGLSKDARKRHNRNAKEADASQYVYFYLDHSSFVEATSSRYWLPIGPCLPKGHRSFDYTKSWLRYNRNIGDLISGWHASGATRFIKVSLDDMTTDELCWKTCSTCCKGSKDTFKLKFWGKSFTLEPIEVVDFDGYEYDYVVAWRLFDPNNMFKKVK